jgi:hypothetical protein
VSVPLFSKRGIAALIVFSPAAVLIGCAVDRDPKATLYLIAAFIIFEMARRITGD